jgi:hypothetical protein
LTTDLRRARAALAVGLCGLLSYGASGAGAQTIGYSGSWYGATGTYPSTQVDSVYLFNGVDVAKGPVRVAVTVPWMRVKTTIASTTTTVSSVSGATTSTGLGDPLVRLDVRLFENPFRTLRVGAATAVKVPAVSADTGRGTGEADYAVGGTGYASLARTSLMADVLFWKYGDPAGFDFKNTWSYSVGAAQTMGRRWSALASLSGLSAGIGDLAPPVAVNVGALVLVGGRQSLAVMTSFGLNDGSSDVSVGTTWRVWR